MDGKNIRKHVLLKNQFIVKSSKVIFDYTFYQFFFKLKFLFIQKKLSD